MPNLTTSQNQQPLTLGSESRPDGVKSGKAESLTDAMKRVSQISNGAYSVKVKKNTEYNEIQINLYENGRRLDGATAFIDIGHTAQSKAEAKEEMELTAKAMMRMPLPDSYYDRF